MPRISGAWNKAEEKNSGFNPLIDADGKIAGSSLLARHMEMEYKLMLRYGAKEAVYAWTMYLLTKIPRSL